jgi:hypothetical protein
MECMRSIPQLLKMRSVSGMVKEALPELGAVLGRGSFGKVYKGARACAVLQSPPSAAPHPVKPLHSLCTILEGCTIVFWLLE